MVIPATEAQKIQPGDKITVELTVDGWSEQQQAFRCNTGTQGHFWLVRPDVITSHTPKPREPKVGDWVQRRQCKGTYLVEFIRGDGKWAGSRNGDLCSFPSFEFFTIVSEPK